MFARTVRRRWLGVALLLGLAVSVACGDSDGDADPEALTITATDFAFAVSGDLAPGATRIELRNDGDFGHHVQLLRIDGEHTVMEAVEALEGPPPEWLDALGGVGGLDAGERGVVFADLPAGRYGLVCFFDDPDGVPHFAKGMVGEFTLEGAVSEAELPEADVAVRGVDAGDGVAYSFEAPDTVKAGRVNISFENAGSELHEMNVLRVPDGTTPEQLGALLASEGQPEGVTGVGGTQGVAPGGPVQIASFDFEKGGSYLLLCGIPNAQGIPHLAGGMVKLVTAE